MLLQLMKKVLLSLFNFAKGKNYYVKEISTVEGWQLSNDTYIICAEPFETNECYDKDNLVCSISLTNSVANDHTVKVQKTTEDNLPLNGWQKTEKLIRH